MVLERIQVSEHGGVNGNKVKKGLRCSAECSDCVPTQAFSIAVKIKMLSITFAMLDHCCFKYNLHLGLSHADSGPYLGYRQLQYKEMPGKVGESFGNGKGGIF